MSNAGTFILIIVVLRLIISWSRQRQGNNARPDVLVQETSWRFLVLVLVHSTAYLLLVFWLVVTLESGLAPIQIEWLRESLQFTGAILIPLVTLRSLPPWIAWRLCLPLGLLRLSRFCYWFTPGANARELEQFAALLQAGHGVPPAPAPPQKKGWKEKLKRFFLLKKAPKPFVVDAGTVAALALAAEVGGHPARAKQQLQAFDLCPPGIKTPRMLRRFAFEALAWQAAKRSDWQTVEERTRHVCGRAKPLLKCLAAHHLRGVTKRPHLWLAWSIFPGRRQALPLVRAATRRKPPQVTEPLSQPVPESLRSRHLDLLRRAAEGAPLDMAEVFQVTQGWDGEFSPERKEILLRRGLELGARDLLSLAEKLQNTLLEELEELVSVALGEVPSEIFVGAGDEKPGLTAMLFIHLKNRLYDEISRTQELFRLPKDIQVADEAILDIWERWLALHEAVTRLHRLLGDEALATLWYGGLREDAWNSASRLSNACGNRIAWISIIQFHWVAEIAARVGDADGVKINRENMKLCGYHPPKSRSAP